MAYLLSPTESTESEIRRAATERLDDAIGLLDGLTGSEPAEIEEAVHKVRKRCKEVRGLARLVRPALGLKFKPFDRAVRDAAATLSSIRDAHAILATFDNLRAAQAGSATTELDEVRIGLAALAADATIQLQQGDTRLAVARALLAVAKEQIDDWTIPSGFSPLGDGLHTTYRDGRKGLRRACNKTTDRRMHEWRKAVKYLWYQIRLLEPAAPSILKPLINRLDDLGDALGDDHDLTVLTERLDRDPHAYGSPKAVKRTRRLAKKQQRELRKRAFRLGETLYVEDDQTFVARIKAYWKTTLKRGEERPAGGITDLIDSAPETRTTADRGLPDVSDSGKTIERERKYLVDSQTDPADIGAALGEGIELRQGYLAVDTGVAVRVRDAGPEGCTLTIKAGGGAVRTELEWSIDQAIFDEAWALTRERRVAKTRYRIPFGEHTIELDVFADVLDGLIVAEVEFDSDEAMARFDPPEWFGLDVTDDMRYTNSSLAAHGLDERDAG
jgi:CYTH domain-containing protein/CHAD domain-containing protein